MIDGVGLAVFGRRSYTIVEAMAKLMALAFACDLTRVGTFQTTQAASRPSWPELNISNWHGTSHDGSATGQDKIQKVVVKHMEWLKVLATTFEQTPDGPGNLLDSSAILTVNVYPSKHRDAFA